MSKRILIGITTAETVCNDTVESIYNMNIPDNVTVSLHIVHAYNVAEGRNKLVDYMLANGFDYIFFVDSDVILPKNALVDLYNMQWYFSVGTYPRKEKSTINSSDPYTTLYIHNEKNKECFSPVFMPFSYLQPGYITQVDCCGLGCALIMKELFSKISKPYFVFATERANKDLSYCLGEDMYFCRKVIQEGKIDIWAHGSVICGHVGKYIYEFNK